MNTILTTVEAALHWIKTYEGEEVANRAEQILCERAGEFLAPDGSVKEGLLVELKEEAWRTCTEVEDRIPLSMTTFFAERDGLPLNAVFSWLERRYGRLAIVAAAIILSEPAQEFVLKRDTSFVTDPLGLRDEVLELFQVGSFAECGWQVYFM